MYDVWCLLFKVQSNHDWGLRMRGWGAIFVAKVLQGFWKRERTKAEPQPLHPSRRVLRTTTVSAECTTRYVEVVQVRLFYFYQILLSSFIYRASVSPQTEPDLKRFILTAMLTSFGYIFLSAVLTDQIVIANLRLHVHLYSKLLRTVVKGFRRWKA